MKQRCDQVKLLQSVSVVRQQQFEILFFFFSSRSKRRKKKTNTNTNEIQILKSFISLDMFVVFSASFFFE